MTKQYNYAVLEDGETFSGVGNARIVFAKDEVDPEANKKTMEGVEGTCIYLEDLLTLRDMVLGGKSKIDLRKFATAMEIKNTKRGTED